MKKHLLFWLSVLSSVLVIVFLVWAFTRHGTMGLVRVNGTFKLAFVALGLVALFTPVLAWLAAGLKSRGKKAPGHILALAVIILSLPGLLGVPAAFVALGGVIRPGIGDTPPQLFVTAQTGVFGIPDLAVTFNTAGATKNTLEWGKVSAPGTIMGEPVAARTHAFLLEDLEPDTDYWYRVTGGGSYVFRTAAAGGSLHFAVSSDAHYGSSSRRADLTGQMLRQIAAAQNGFDYFFLTGDMAHWGFDTGHWQEAFRGLSGATSVIPFRLAAGNHDTMFSGFGSYLRYAYPDGLPLDGGSKLWSRIDVGDIHFFIIDLEWSAEAFTDEQAAWLEAELASVPADDWKIVLGHGFTYGSGLVSEGWQWYDNPETIARLVPLYERYGVDLVFSGHNHQMEVLEKSGITYIICGAFGGLPDSGRTYTSPYSLWYESGRYGFADVTIEGDDATVVFRAPDGGEIYRHDLTKDPG